ncbi:MAG: 3-methyl-2-oxobutanoate hydroxymethyltransferase [Anaerolineaceae bacterium]|nr:3-methyl-2-oxobutanoate hydroxymethyltransferase [Anaerolineaceae bacterium]
MSAVSSLSKTKNKITLKDLQKKKASGHQIFALTAYDYSLAKVLDASGVDLILVGDSLGMVVLGYETTLSVTMEEMLHHCKAVARGAKHSFLVGDMPFLSYQVDVHEAVRNAGRFLSEAGMNSVKVEGGVQISSTVQAIVRAGIPVMGHIGLMPQSVHKIGGYGVQGNTASKARILLEDALALEEAGCFAIVLESVPTRVARLITERLSIPTVGIGAGPGCDGQILVTYDLLGLFDSFTPKFVKQYANLREAITEAVEQYICDVRDSKFPCEAHSSSISDVEWRLLLENLNDIGL